MAKNNQADWPRLGNGSNPTEDAEVGLGHIVPIKVYKMVYLSLVALTAITVWAAYQPFGDGAHLLTALGIATVKAGVVTFVFMHLQYESKIIWGIVIYPIFIFLLIVAGTLGDASVKLVPQPASVASQANQGEEVVVR